jgi:hypothetical protein
MGNVKDRYFKYAENGDQYVGRCLALLPVLHVDLAVSPPFFVEQADMEWVNGTVQLQFRTMFGMNEFGKMLRMCLSSLLYHRKWIDEFLGFNHVVRNSSICFRNATELKIVEEEKWIQIVHPWSCGQANYKFSGVPPYCTILQHVIEVRSEQRVFCLNFVDKIKQALTEFGVNAGSLSEERVTAIMNEFYQKFESQINR